MVAGYCVASAVDGWQSARPAASESNPFLRTSTGSANVPMMAGYKAAICGGAILANYLAKGKARHAILLGVIGLLGVQTATDIHNAH